MFQFELTIGVSQSGLWGCVEHMLYATYRDMQQMLKQSLSGRRVCL